MIGERFGMLVVIGAAGTNKHQKRIWHCRCDCGSESHPVTSSLRNGTTNSCGCLKRAGNRRTHDKRHSRVYVAWCNMKGRCDNEQRPQYKDWGGRGITYDPRWSSFENFYKDMGDPAVGMSLDRINNNGNYCKANCRWASRTTQRKNARNILPITISGRTRLITEWCDELGMSQSTVYRRMKRGIDPISALTQPITPRELRHLKSS